MSQATDETLVAGPGDHFIEAASAETPTSSCEGQLSRPRLSGILKAPSSKQVEAEKKKSLPVDVHWDATK